MLILQHASIDWKIYEFTIISWLGRITNAILMGNTYFTQISKYSRAITYRLHNVNSKSSVPIIRNGEHVFSKNSVKCKVIIPISRLIFTFH